ncbi:P-type conjugative transfer protein TrbJ [Mesorhizobium sp. M0130]|uniref:P-type conjugative transfer protein TrbJ n=1 Tax=Mesorhizobium sp. M0130 TaxID=2956887 RepID=UPI00333B16D9
MADYVQPAHALIVFDPSNYAQNVLTAARSLEQINNQIQSLQNQATMLQNMARNLQRLDFSSVGQLTGSLQRIDGLMTQASGLSFDLDKLQNQWRVQYPESYDATNQGQRCGERRARALAKRHAGVPPNHERAVADRGERAGRRRPAYRSRQPQSGRGRCP